MSNRIITENRQVKSDPQQVEGTHDYINCDAQPRIPSFTEGSIIQHILGGMVDPAKLIVADVFRAGEDSLKGEEFIRRAQALPGVMNACALDFFAQSENWKYLPKGDNWIVFAGTIFCNGVGNMDNNHYVRSISRLGRGWDTTFGWLSDFWHRDCRVAVLASQS